MIKRKTLKKKMTGGNSVQPEMSGYKLNEGVGGLNDPLIGIESSRLMKGGKNNKKKRNTKKRKRGGSKKKYISKI
tara:strand:+ start:118 stop:342 length:225 start_codon:yes stop_codon:yes gene_type:complete